MIIYIKYIKVAINNRTVYTIRKIGAFNMIYIVSIGNMVSGGPETLHQAARLLSSYGNKVGMYYVQPHTINIPERFSNFNIDVVEEIEDSSENVLIVPETLTFVLGRYKKIKKCIWWLSVEKYFETEPRYLVKWRLKVHGLSNALFPFIYIYFIFKRKIHTYRYHFEDNGTYFHMYNCEYAHRFLLDRGVPEHRTLYLCGPLNDSFFELADQLAEKKERENIIIYNPKKGIEFTQKLIKKANEMKIDASFVPIINMNPPQIADLMSRSKIYIDFGEFPGPERIPREAVTMGCNIITSRNGAAGNEIDVPIPNNMKYDTIDENLPDIINKMKDMLGNYDTYYNKYDKYREKVREQIPLLNENLQRLMEMI